MDRDPVSTFPIIPNRVVPPRWSEVYPYLGQYYFGNELGCDVSKMFCRAEKKWAVVGVLCLKTQPGIFEFPETSTIGRKCKSPISVMWLSRCGEYVLYPKYFQGFKLDTAENDYQDWWVPKATANWDEFYTHSASEGAKYCYQNRKYSVN
jgi:hypothetical protein